MKIKEVRELEPAKLQEKLYELRRELFNLRMQKATGQLQNPVRMRLVRRDIARVKMTQSERA